MIDFFKTLYFAYKYKVPLVIDKVWYNLNVYDKGAYPKVMTSDKKYMPISYDTVYPFATLPNGMAPYYKVAYYYAKPFGDYLRYGDNITCTLRLDSIK